MTKKSIYQTIKIRSARPKDLASIYALGRKTRELDASNDTVFFDRGEIEGLIKKPKDNIILVILAGKKFIGFLVAKIISCEWCMIDSIAVDPLYRGQGIGNLVLKHLQNILKKRRIRYLQAFVAEEAARSRKFWHQQGFKEGKKFIWIEKCF
jgi:ribosomal protein S18 acetylase RimI-like enzyme